MILTSDDDLLLLLCTDAIRGRWNKKDVEDDEKSFLLAGLLDRTYRPRDWWREEAQEKEDDVTFFGEENEVAIVNMVVWITLNTKGGK